MSDIQHQNLPGLLGEVRHCYGERVHILTNPLVATLLSKACNPATIQPEFNRLLDRLYDHLVTAAMGVEFPRIRARVPTRMTLSHPDCAFEGEVLDPSVQVVVAGIARAGTLPAHRVLATLSEALPPVNIRVDHLYMNRRTNLQGEVVGIDFAGSKIGGTVDGAWLFLPDPMGATGQSMGYALNHYQEGHFGVPARMIALHLIITPEYLRFMAAHHPETRIYALRLDRGLSDPRALRLLPGEKPEWEKGLNEHQYIIPGAGGIGEVINNSFV